MVENPPLFKVVTQGLAYPEGSFWSEKDQCLYFVEWMGDKVCRWQDGRVETMFSTGKGSGPSGCCQDSAGDFWVCLYSTGCLARYTREGKLLQSFGWAGESRFKGPNDLVLDNLDGVFFTDSGNFDEDWLSGRPAGTVYYLNPKGVLHQIASGICYANGIALSKDGSRLWVNEHRRNRVLEIEIFDEETYCPPVIFRHLDNDCLLEPELCYQLGPDGMCLDGQSRLWLAHFGGGKIICLDQSGETLHKLRLPQGRNPTNITWNPQANSLFITEAENGLLYSLDLNRLAEFESEPS